MSSATVRRASRPGLDVLLHRECHIAVQWVTMAPRDGRGRHSCPAAAVGAFLIVSADADLTSMSPWRGRPIIDPPQFDDRRVPPGTQAEALRESRPLTVNAEPG
jgi:hypothetical protein